MPTNRTPAYKAGFEDGQGAGAWVLDGNSTAEDANWLIKGHEDGDPQVMDLCEPPNNLVEVANEHHIRLSNEAQVENYHSGFQEGFWDSCLAQARYITTLPPLAVS